MSNPENILAKYRTYSYQHVLIACENTDVAEALSKSTNMYKYLQTAGTARFSKQAHTKGDYIVVANNLVDADFVIDELTWMSVFFPEPGPKHFEQFASYATEGTFNVLEPKGVNFLNILSQAATCFGTDTSNMVFLLKTFFVGHEDAGQVDYVTNIKGMMFVMTDITADFSVVGSTYSVQFVGMANGAAKLPQNVTGPQVSLNMNTTGKTVGEALDKLQSQINTQYKTHFLALTDLNDGASPGQRVDYIINIDEASGYRDYLLDQIPDRNSDEGAASKGGIISFGQNQSIESMILDVLRASKKFGEEANGEGEDKKTFTPKLLSTIQSGKDGNESFYRMIYTLTKMNVPISTIETINDPNQNFVEQGNALELDYFFSGKNTDILEFNLKMEMGLAFFQTVTTAKTQPENSADNIEEVKITGANKATSAPSKDLPDFPNCRADQSRTTPILFSTDFKEAKQKNNKFPLASIDFQSMLQRQAAVEMLAAKIKIMGNPVLLNNITMTPSEAANGRPDPSLAVSGSDNVDVMKDWTSVPGLVKVNIFSPSTETGGDYDKKFWYDGWYYVISVENSFSQGIFTQTIEMNSLPLESNLTQDDEEVPIPRGAGGGGR